MVQVRALALLSVTLLVLATGVISAAVPDTASLSSTGLPHVLQARVGPEELQALAKEASEIQKLVDSAEEGISTLDPFYSTLPQETRTYIDQTKAWIEQKNTRLAEIKEKIGELDGPSS